MSQDKRFERVYRKNSRILLPVYVLCIIFSHIDRTNLAFAALSMNRDLGFNTAVYGLGSALFFPTFCAFQVPSNFVMLRVGVRVWLAFLLVAWGVVASCFALIHNVTSFFVLRLLLGLFEAGATPAMWYSLSQFYPQERIIKPYSFLSMGILLANVLGAPLAAGFLAMDGIGGLRGWQWLFMLEGVPPVLLGLLVLLLVPNRVSEARWLTAEDKEVLAADMAKAAEASPPPEAIPRRPLRLLGLALANPLVTYMCVVGFLLATAAYTFLFFLPMIVEALLSGHSLGLAAASKAAGKGGRAGLLPVLLTSVPYTVGAISTWLVAHSSERRRELYWHCSLSLLLSGVFFAFFPLMATASVAAGFAALVLTVGGAAAANGPGVTIVADISRGPSQVVGMPIYNSISAVGGFVGPYMAGAIVQQTGNFKLIAVIMGCLLLGCGSMVAALKPLAAWRARKLLRGAAASDDEEQQQQRGSGDGSGSSTVLPARPAHAAAAAEGGDDVASREPSACVLVGGLKDAAVAGGAVRTAGGVAGLAAAEGAAGSSDWAHRRPAAAMAAQQQ